MPTIIKCFHQTPMKHSTSQGGLETAVLGAYCIYG